MEDNEMGSLSLDGLDRMCEHGDLMGKLNV